MKKLLLLSAVAVLLISSALRAQNQTWHAPKPPCEDCSRFPYQPSGCNYSNCLVQLLSTVTRDDLLNYFALPGNVCDKILFVRNRGVNNIQDYSNALEPYEFNAMMDAYAHFVAVRTPALPVNQTSAPRNDEHLGHK
jgi:hypothetical protein